jgi:crotonobetainyl-CoA hydratase
LGGGFELALACDIIIASETAAFALPEPRVGAIAVGGGIDRLIRQMPMRAAMGYLLTGQRMSASQAFGYGIINAVVPSNGLAAEVRRWCQLILECSPMAIQTTKALARRSLSQPDLAGAISGLKDQPEYLRWWDSPDATEGVRAFTEKRAPVWSPPG